MRFSVIIPVYNVEKYIERCLESVVSQTFRDYEVIIVDDETPDRSMELVQSYVDADPQRFTVIHQKNLGLGGARNTGVAASKGEYVVFLDSDDYIHEDMLKVIDQQLGSGRSELLIYNYIDVMPSGEEVDNACGCTENVMVTTVRDRAQLFRFGPNAWRKVYLRSFLHECSFAFPEHTLYEDVYTYILLAKAKTIQLCNAYLYYYIHRDGSIMNSGCSPRVMEITKVVDFVYETFVSEGIYGQFKIQLDTALINAVDFIIKSINVSDQGKIYQRQLAEYIVKRFPNYRNNPNITIMQKSIFLSLSKGYFSVYRVYEFLVNMRKSLR